MKNYKFYKIFSLVVLFLNSSFFNPVLKINDNAFIENLNYSVDLQSYNESVNMIYLINDFNGFKESLAFKESGGRYSIKFISSPILQEKIFLINVNRNKWILRKDINWFVGTFINGIEVTESGIIAAAHLSGAGNVKKYLRANGDFNKKDAFGTSISAYMSYFANYDLSFFKAVRKPNLNLIELER